MADEVKCRCVDFMDTSKCPKHGVAPTPDYTLTTVKVSTRKPDKYLLIDRELGHQWEIRDGRWMRAENPISLT